MRVWGIAGRHAPPPLEPAEAPFPGVARRIPFRVVGPRVRAPDPGRNGGLGVLPRPSRAEGVAIIGPIRDQAGPRRIRFHPGPDLGVVVARAARHAQVQGTAPSIR